MKYHIWTEGCQMNVADSQRVGSSLEHLGYSFTDKAEEADVIAWPERVITAPVHVERFVSLLAGLVVIPQDRVKIHA